MPSALVLWAMAYGLGVFLGEVLGVGLEAARRGLGAAAAVLLLAFAGGRLRGWALLLGAAALGVSAQARLPRTEPPLLAQLPAREAVLLEGRVAAAPEGTAEGALLRVDAGRALLDLGADEGYPIVPPARVLLSVRGPLLEPLLRGDRVRVRARVRSAVGAENPGGPDPLRRLRGEGIVATAAVPAAAVLRLLGEEEGNGAPAPRRQVERLRAALDRALRRHLRPNDGDDPTRYALLASLVLGERAALGQADALRADQGRPSLSQAFRDAGVFHLLSVSGFHLAVATFLVYAGLTALLLRVPPLSRRFAVRRLAAAAALPVTVLYTLLTGAEVATVRAAGVAVLWLLAVACGRRARLVEALAAAALWILAPAPLGAPLSLFDPSFQLSLAATLGIACLRPVPVSPGLKRDPIARLSAAGLRLLSASVAALLATAPLSALHFAQFQGAGLLGNLLAVPLCEFLVVPLGLLGAVAALACPPLGAPVLWLAGVCAAVMMALIDEVAGLGLSWFVPAPGTAALLLWAAGLWALARRGRGWPWPLVLSLLLYFGAWALPPRRLVATFLDVGQGDAAVLELPRGGAVVVDAGGPGERAVAAFLHRRGHRRIDLLVTSHPHPDHIGGVPVLRAEFPIGSEWSAERAPRPLVLQGVLLEPLFPGPGGLRRELGENDNSLVLRASYAGRALLFPGDLELPGELALLEEHDRRGGELRADVLKVPHHGSRTSSSASLLREVAPALAVGSLGRRNRYGFPHREVLERYREAGICLLRTDRDGAVQVAVTPDGAIRARLRTSRWSAAPWTGTGCLSRSDKAAWP